MCRSSIYSDGNSKPQSCINITEYKYLYDSTLQLYTCRYYSTYRHNVFMVITRRDWFQRRCIRCNTEHTERYTDQHIRQSCDSGIQPDTDIRKLHRQYIYGKCSSKPGHDDSLTSHHIMQCGRLLLYTYGFNIYWYDLFMELTDTWQRADRGSFRYRK